jgi:hypothetical protein
MKSFIVVLLLVCSSVWVYAAQSDHVTFDQAGFSIDILDAPKSSTGSKPLIMTLPARNGFSANVNILIQPYPGSLQDYKELSQTQFKQLGLRVIDSDESKNTLTWEYAGKMSGREFHFVAKVIKEGNLFYLATGTDLEINWPITSAQLKRVVKSFTTK